MARLRFAALLLSGVALSACSTVSEMGAKPKQPETTAAQVSASIDVQIARAQSLRGQGNYAEATRLMSQLMLAMPDDPRVVGEYGKLLVQQGQAKDAIAFLTHATELSPSEWSFYSALGVAHDQNNDPESARTAYDRALALSPGNASVLNNFAMSRMLVKDLPMAIRLINQARMIDSTDPKIARNAELIAGLAPAPQSPTKANAAPDSETGPTAPKVMVTKKELPVSGEKTADKTPNSLLPKNGVVMQGVPADPQAGPTTKANANKAIAKAAPAVAKEKPKAEPETKVAEADAKPAPRKPSAQDGIPRLRMAADIEIP